METRYSDLQVEELLNKACFLDPHFKSFSFLSEEDKKYVMLLVEEEAVCIKELTSEATQLSKTDNEPQKKKPRKGLLSLLEDMMDTPSTTADGPQEAAKKEIQKYICIETNPTDNPIKWWKTYHAQLPLLTSMARKYLCIPVTSVPSERAFSVAGNIVNSKRSCLLPENTNMLSFLAYNLNQ